MSKKPLIGRSGGSSRLSARDRRDSQADAMGESYVFPLASNDKGKVGLVLASNSPHYIDPKRGLAFRVDPNSGFEVSSRSPFALRRVEGGNVEVDPKTRALVAKPTTDDVKDAVGETVTALLQREAVARVAADQVLDARVVILEAVVAPQIEIGTVTLNGTTPIDVGSAIVTSDTSKCSIMLTRRTPGTLPGEVVVEDGTIVDNSKFYVYSTSAADDGIVQYIVTVIP